MIINSLKPDNLQQGEIEISLLDEAVKAIVSEFDHQNGGFGTAPKFPCPEQWNS